MRRVVSIAFALSLAAFLSCSEIPTAPRLGSVMATGRITDRDGPPIPGIRVYYQPETETPGLTTFAGGVTDADGRYTLKLTEGVYRMVLDSNYGAGYPSVTVRGIRVGAAGSTVDYRYTGVRVSGSITGLNGALLSDAGITAYGPSDASALAVAGQYSLLLPAGTYTLYAYPGWTPPGLPRIAADQVPILSDTTIDFPLTGFAVTATMTLTGGAPMIGANFDAQSANVSASATTGLDGTATVYLPAGSYFIRAIPYPRNIVGPRTASRSIQSDDNVPFDFAGPRWDMTVRRASDGTPLSGARTYLRQAGGLESAFSDADAIGRSSFLVRAGVAYDLDVQWAGGGIYHIATVPNLSSAADTTFDISVNDPAAP